MWKNESIDVVEGSPVDRIGVLLRSRIEIGGFGDIYCMSP